jgi:DNA-binding transcriptional MerR regulator
VIKGPQAFRTISEAAEIVGVRTHVLRFWELRFHFLRPMKCAGGRRFYRPRDLVLLSNIRRLLYDEGYSIKAVQELYRRGGLASAPAGGPATPDGPPARGCLESTLREFNLVRDRLQAVIDQPA